MHAIRREASAQPPISKDEPLAAILRESHETISNPLDPIQVDPPDPWVASKSSMHVVRQASCGVDNEMAGGAQKFCS